MSSTILVTGGAGLLGHAVLEEFATRYHRVALDTVLPPDPLDGVVYVQADLRDTSRTVDMVRQHSVTDIVHAGAISSPRLLLDQPGTVLAINVQGTQNVLEAARLGRCRRLVFMSSAAVYGTSPPDAVITEESPLRPDSMYAVSKAAAEMLVTGYHHCFGLETVILRPVSIYGPRRSTSSLASYLVANALDGVPSRISGATYTSDLIYVVDVARAVASALESPIATGRAYTIGTGLPTTSAALAAMIQQLLPGSFIEIEATPDESSGEGQFCVDAAARDLGFHCDWTLERGMRTLIDVMRDRPDLRATARAAFTFG